MENGDSFNPSNNGQGIIALVLLVCLFGHFIYYTFKPSVDEEDNIMFGPENKPIQLNSINEIDLLQFLYNCKFIIFGFLLLMLLVVLVFLIRSYTSRKCCFQGNNQFYNVIVNGVWSTKVKVVVMSFLDMVMVLFSFPFLFKNFILFFFKYLILFIRQKFKIYLFILFSINYIFCTENYNPSNNNNTCETICLLLFFYLFGVFLGYISDSTSKKNIKIKTILDNSESTPTSITDTGLNSVKEIDIFQILYNLEYIFFIIIIVLILLILKIKLYSFINIKAKKLIIFLITLTVFILITYYYYFYIINFEKLNYFKNLVYVFLFMLNIQIKL
jgi:hypothetical protein